MKKKLVLLTTTAVTASICLGVMMFSVHRKELFARGELEYQMVLNDKTKVVSKDNGYLHQMNVKNNKFDFVGWSSTGGALGSIKKDTYGDGYVYNGMIYNRSVINGFKQLTVKFSNGDLRYIFTDFLMENMNFDGELLTSETPVNVPDNKAYFLVYTTSETPVSIDYVKVGYTCDSSIDLEMLYNKNTPLGNARSMAKSYVKEDSFIEIENNPTKYTNNYSRGNDISTDHDNSWYRWNGKYFTDSKKLGTDFTFAMTVMGDYERMVNNDKNFHYAVWPQFSYGAKKWSEEKQAYIGDDEQWYMTYVGNDNYEPLGKDHSLFPDDPHVKESYAGRYYADYRYVGPTDYDWAFVDPDQATLIDDSSVTLRDAYNRYNLPFWFMKFHVYLDQDNDPMCDVTINGMLVYSTWIFEHYDTENTPSIYIHTLPCHVVNYGLDAEATPDSSYKGYFTYPRLIAE